MQILLQRDLLKVFLYGSRARGEAKSDSDIDLAVIVTENNIKRRKAIRYTAVDIGLDYDLILSTSVWGKDQWMRLQEINTGLYQSIQRDGIQIYPDLETLREN
jgi:predicted nucleotidyltransferase